MRGNLARAGGGARLGIRRRVSVRRRRPWHWFDHPEMQARIAKAEADLREGRYFEGSSWEDLRDHLDSLKR